MEFLFQGSNHLLFGWRDKTVWIVVNLIVAVANVILVPSI